jgi:5,6-dimethylbenzimidazole synthase
MSVSPSRNHLLSEEDRRGRYRAIYGRRDVRAQFLPDPVPDAVLARLLHAAHQAPSVGFRQPWNFVVVRARARRKGVYDAFLRERARAADLYDEPRRSRFLALELEGILDAPLNVCVTCDPSRGGPHVLGRSAVPESDVYGTCGAVQNFWLAARAEGIDLGWVSIVQPDELRAILAVPEPVTIIAYLGVGYVSDFADRPDLARAGWRERRPLDELVFEDGWGRPAPGVRAALSAIDEEPR